MWNTNEICGRNSHIEKTLAKESHFVSETSRIITLVRVQGYFETNLNVFPKTIAILLFGKTNHESCQFLFTNAHDIKSFPARFNPHLPGETHQSIEILSISIRNNEY